MTETEKANLYWSSPFLLDIARDQAKIINLPEDDEESGKPDGFAKFRIEEIPDQHLNLFQRIFGVRRYSQPRTHLPPAEN